MLKATHSVVENQQRSEFGLNASEGIPYFKRNVLDKQPAKKFDTLCINFGCLQNKFT